jgi:hypothetical protein
MRITVKIRGPERRRSALRLLPKGPTHYWPGIPLCHDACTSRRFAKSQTSNHEVCASRPYQYDSLNRLGSAAASGSVAYSQSFSYDNYGNMSCSASPAESNCLQTTYNTTLNNNQISNYTYDAAGNLLNDGTYGY